ncbi:cold shock domain-containing protein [Paenarthrobacter sp. Z7-10]|uniref:cold-shock protein n=1 Tax=Paenarthrobacter sp. Z7-10 TaxID=2787635 RepID=UPI0022A9F32B|nr:cold shock domain-containing protein [Paenarthrobacter sp. Z7-10]MCZ2402597.1 cold shock domain-containing protein [Paenarthrobacter sp. Z7-10]
MPTGKVKWYDNDKGFGFLTTDDGKEVFLHANALPEGVTEVKVGTRMEFGVADGRKGAQAMAARILDAAPSVAKAKRMPAKDLAPIVQDLVSLLERSVGTLNNGKYPDGDAARIAAVLRKVAENFDA